MAGNIETARLERALSPQPMKHRASAPALSSEQLRFAQSVPGSGVTSGASSFLTPFLLGPQSMSPPPKQEVDDYFNVHGHHDDGKSHHRRKDEKRRNVEEDETPRCIQCSPVLGPHCVASTGSDDRVCDAGTHGNVGIGPDATQSKFNESLSPRTDRLSLATTTNRDADRFSFGPPNNLRQSGADIEESPAANSLRRLSQQQTVSTDLDSQKLRRMSTALSSTYTFLKSKTSKVRTNHTHERSVNPKNNARSRNRDAYQKSLPNPHESSRRHPTLRETGVHSELLTPSTITLRKASNARVVGLGRSSMSVSLSHEDETMRTPDAPTSELLAFYSAVTSDGDQPNYLDFTSVDAIVSQRSPSPDASSRSETAPSDHDHRPSVQLPKVRQHSILAANTITFTDVHVAPGTFALDTHSKKRSSVNTDQPPRRISVVQFRSRNSVHEVVWREDETTSDSSLATSSRTSTSPLRQDQSLPSILPSPEDEAIQVQQSKHASPRDAPLSSSLTQQPQAGLFQWSWKKLAESSNDATANEREDAHSSLLTSKPDPARTLQPSDPYAKTILGRSASLVEDILSFPPLRDRSSTFEWRQASLGDLNDPLAVRPNPNPMHSNDYSNKAHMSVPSTDNDIPGNGVEVQTLHNGLGGTRASSYLFSSIGAGVRGRVGSSIGSSSHARVLHTRKC